MSTKPENIDLRPRTFEHYTAQELWASDHTSQKMLEYHLNDDIEASSRSSKFIDESVSWIQKHFEIVAGSRIADFGCAVGHYTSRLAQIGAEVTGIDFSPRSIKYAREQAQEKSLEIEYLRQNYLDVELNQEFDLIIMIMCDFCALSPSQRNKLMSIFKKHLAHGGKVLLDVYTESAFKQKTESASYEKNWMGSFWSPRDHYCFINSIKYEGEMVALDKYTIIHENEEEHVVYNWLQHFTKDSLRQEFEENGFKVVEFFGNVAGKGLEDEDLEMAVEISLS